MMEPIVFRVDGIPKAQPRPRAFSRGGHARVYDAGTAEGWKSQIAIAAKPFIPSEPLTMPLRVNLTFYMPRPKSHYRTGKHAGELRPDAPVWHTGKPDRDNLDKAVMDALTTLRMWGDDGQVCDGRIRKLYDTGEGPGCLVTILELA
jgi:crossover junction endodeoxyribonuclease RusA